MAGTALQLLLVVRNDGNLVSESTTLLDMLPTHWHIVGATTTKGLVSIEPGRVRVALGRLRPGEQVIITIVVETQFTPQLSVAQQCVSMVDGATDPSEVCAPLPEVLPMPTPTTGVIQIPSPTNVPQGPLPRLVLLDNVLGQQLPGQIGATVVVRNEGNVAAHETYLHVELGDTWRLSDMLTTLGLVGAVDHTGAVRIGRLDPSALVAITLRGWPLSAEEAAFCATLSTDGQQRDRVCGYLSSDVPQPAVDDLQPIAGFSFKG